jgi:hypothetical protein
LGNNPLGCEFSLREEKGTQAFFAEEFFKRGSPMGGKKFLFLQFDRPVLVSERSSFDTLRTNGRGGALQAGFYFLFLT